MIPAAPKASLISARADWSIYLTYAVKCMISGEAIVTDWCKGYAEGANFTSPLNTDIAAPGTQEKLDEVAEALRNGSLRVFAGPWNGVNHFTGEAFSCAEGEWVDESVTRSAPYFCYIIEGITLLDA